MPPRFAYWTILIDNKPTAFRARDQHELLPTLTQLKRTNQDVVMKWFAQGRLWDSPEAQRESWKKPKPPVERRGRDWRPGGDHKDPRARFDREAQRRKKREERAARPPPDRPPSAPRAPSQRFGAPRGDRPWQTKPTGPRAQRKPWQHKPASPRPDRKPWQSALGGDRPRKPFQPRRPQSGSYPRRRKKDDEPPDRH
jgi:hypothetical protein